MNKKQVAVLTAVLVLVAGAGWAMGFFNRTDPQLAELEQMRDANFQRMEEMSDEERRSQYEGFRDKVRELSDDQRRQFYESSRPMYEQRQLERLNEFFAKSPEEQTKELDKMIDESQERRQRRESSRNESPDRGGRAERGGRGGRSNATPQQRDQRSKERLDRSTPEMRAKRDRFRDMMSERRKQRGLDPSEGWGRFGGRG